RLQAEIAGLSAAVEEARKSADSAGDGDSEVSPDQLAAMIRGAQSELLALHLDSLLGPEAEGLHVFDPEGCLEKRLAGQLERLGKQQPTAAAAAQGASGSLVYEVYTKPTSGAPAVPKDLEARLARLEAAIGEAHLRAPALSGDLAGRPLLEATHRLAGKLALLEPASLEQVDSRLAALNHRLAQLTSDKREPLADADTQTRVAELYELVKKWDGLADSVHGIVGRLTALRELHEQAMQFSGALNLIDQSQRASSAQLESSASLLAGLEKRLTEDLKTEAWRLSIAVNQVEGRSAHTVLLPSLGSPAFHNPPLPAFRSGSGQSQSAHTQLLLPKLTAPTQILALLAASSTRCSGRRVRQRHGGPVRGGQEAPAADGLSAPVGHQPAPSSLVQRALEAAAADARHPAIVDGTESARLETLRLLDEDSKPPAEAAAAAPRAGIEPAAASCRRRRRTAGRAAGLRQAAASMAKALASRQEPLRSEAHRPRLSSVEQLVVSWRTTRVREVRFRVEGDSRCLQQLKGRPQQRQQQTPPLKWTASVRLVQSQGQVQLMHLSERYGSFNCHFLPAHCLPVYGATADSPQPAMCTCCWSFKGLGGPTHQAGGGVPSEVPACRTSENRHRKEQEEQVAFQCIIRLLSKDRIRHHQDLRDARQQILRFQGWPKIRGGEDSSGASQPLNAPLGLCIATEDASVMGYTSRSTASTMFYFLAASRLTAELRIHTLLSTGEKVARHITASKDRPTPPSIRGRSFSVLIYLCRSFISNLSDRARPLRRDLTKHRDQILLLSGSRRLFQLLAAALWALLGAASQPLRYLASRQSCHTRTKDGQLVYQPPVFYRIRSVFTSEGLRGLGVGPDLHKGAPLRFPLAGPDAQPGALVPGAAETPAGLELVIIVAFVGQKIGVGIRGCGSEQNRSSHVVTRGQSPFSRLDNAHRQDVLVEDVPGAAGLPLAAVRIEVDVPNRLHQADAAVEHHLEEKVAIDLVRAVRVDGVNKPGVGWIETHLRIGALEVGPGRVQAGRPGVAGDMRAEAVPDEVKVLPIGSELGLKPLDQISRRSSCQPWLVATLNPAVADDFCWILRVELGVGNASLVVVLDCAGLENVAPGEQPVGRVHLVGAPWQQLDRANLRIVEIPASAEAAEIVVADFGRS
uniref:ZZ-type domain-containing protein n=1 Tax=Macrostomum lignano TaxID=282301 RepID=A0A1I8F7Q1_9PLAT